VSAASAGAAVACVACGGSAARPRHAFPPYELYACTECGSTRILPLPDAEELSHYYDHEYAIVAESSSADVRRRAEEYRDTDEIVARLRRHAPQARRVAEVGCAYGYLLFGLRRAGYEVEGFELSSVTAAVGRETLGLPIRDASLPDPGSGYDAIVMRHVLEHFRDPDDALRRIAEALAPGGVLLLATPNARSLSARWFGRDWEWVTPPAHLHLYSPEGLESALRRARLAPVETWTRRGDAQPFLFALARRAAALLGVKGALTRRIGTFGPDALPTGRGGAAVGAKRALLGTLAAVDRLAAPAWRAVWRSGGGEELWAIARRGTE